MPARHRERHVNGRIGWLRTAILSANDGILSFQQRVWCSASQPRIRVTATYWGRDRRTGPWLCRWLPVSTYRSTHRQTPNRLNSSASVWNSERTTRASTRKLAAIYVARGLDLSLAQQVVKQPMGDGMRV